MRGPRTARRPAFLGWLSSLTRVPSTPNLIRTSRVSLPGASGRWAKKLCRHAPRIALASPSHSARRADLEEHNCEKATMQDYGERVILHISNFFTPHFHYLYVGYVGYVGYVIYTSFTQVHTIFTFFGQHISTHLHTFTHISACKCVI